MHLFQEQDGMKKSAAAGPSDCNCLAVRQAARHITQFYDQHLAPSGLRTTQFSILAKLNRSGSMTINALATEMVMGRTTLGRNILPLAARRPGRRRPSAPRPPQQRATVDRGWPRPLPGG